MGSTPFCQGVLGALFRTRLNTTGYSYVANLNQLEAITLKLSFSFTNRTERLQSRTKRACSAPKSKTGICETRHCPMNKSEGSRARFFLFSTTTTSTDRSIAQAPIDQARLHRALSLGHEGFTTTFTLPICQSEKPDCGVLVVSH